MLDSRRKILTAEGYEVFLASSAVEALEAMKTDELIDSVRNAIHFMKKNRSL